MPVWLEANLVSVLNGFAIGFLLFILAVGLSLVFGMMDVLNLAHGALFLGGAYLGSILSDFNADILEIDRQPDAVRRRPDFFHNGFLLGVLGSAIHLNDALKLFPVGAPVTAGLLNIQD